MLSRWGENSDMKEVPDLFRRLPSNGIPLAMKRSWLSVVSVHKGAVAIGRLVARLARTATKSFSGPFVEAMEERQFCFPRDHGMQPNFQTEWWHLVGNLESEDGQEWGYQLTLFRHTPALWLGNQTALRAPFDLYMGHLGVTNVGESAFQFSATPGISLFGQAGARRTGLHVWLKKLTLVEVNGEILVKGRHKDFGAFLQLVPQKPAVLYGNNGLIGNAAHCYAFSSLKTVGEIVWKGNTHSVRGRSFLEHEFGSRMVAAGVEGWDWFMLALDNDVELALAVVRLSGGAVAPLSYGAMVLPGGTWQPLTLGDFTVKQVGSWRSGSTKATYPMGWVATVPSADLELTVHPCIESHEVVSAIPSVPSYWEGPVRVSGNLGGKQVGGKGYAELVGYSRPIGGSF